jgi:transposase
MTSDEKIVQLEAENSQLREQLASSAALIAQLVERTQALEARLAQDSHNSSKPPSSDGFTRSPKNRSLRKSSGKKPGGQSGHEGKMLCQVETPAFFSTHAPQTCLHCQTDLTTLPLGPVLERRQVFEVPALTLVVTEHQLYARTCPTCNSHTKGQFPQDVNNRVQYGPGFRAIAVYLLNYQLLPYGRTAEILNELFSDKVSTGSLALMVAECFERLAEPEAFIKAALQAAPVLHSDETGGYCANKRQWFHVTSSQWLTHYAFHQSRGKRATDEIGILNDFYGVSIHDGFKSYTQYTCQHALCNAHHLRELTFIHEQHHQAWAKAMSQLLLDLKTEVDAARQVGEQALALVRLVHYENLYQKLIELGLEENPPPPDGWPHGKRGRVKQTKAKNLLDRLDTQRQQVLTFAYRFDVPFDNNQAERDLRMIKLQQKISGCFRSLEGAVYFCRIRGYLSTMHKQGESLLCSLLQVFLGQPVLPSRGV